MCFTPFGRFAPWPTIPRCHVSVPSMAVRAVVRCAIAYWSARVGTFRTPGPSAHTSRILPSGYRMSLSTTPCCTGWAPVPMLAWDGAVLDGLDPTVALVYHVPFDISPLRFGVTWECRFSTYRPPASHTSTTTSLGFGWLGLMASVITAPSGASKEKLTSLATVGATSARFTHRVGFFPGLMMPGPYQNIGTSCV